MKTRVLDSWPIVEWIKGGNSARHLDAMFSDAQGGKIRLAMSAINSGEVYYFLMKFHSAALAESWRESSATLPVTIEVPSAGDIWSAASLKGRFSISYADAFSAALAMKHNCPLVTGDPEFRSVGNLTLDWIDKK